MKRYIIFVTFIFFLAMGCTHAPQEITHPKVTAFIEEWKTDFSPDDINYINNYEKYLYSVAKLYRANGVENKLEMYFNGLKNNSQIIARTENKLLQRYAKEKRTRVTENSPRFRLYKTRVLSELHDRLNEERANALQKDLGEDLFNQLIENNRRFNDWDQGAPKNLFPL